MLSEVKNNFKSRMRLIIIIEYFNFDGVYKTIGFWIKIQCPELQTKYTEFEKPD